MQQKVEIVNRNISDLAPFFAVRLQAALAECAEKGYGVRVFETVRSPDRQDWLYAQGRTRPGKIVTHAKAGESFHNMSLACDLVGWTNERWDWGIDYDKITAIMKSHGFESLKFEKPHFQISGGIPIKKAWEIAAKYGLLHLWSIVESNINAKPAKVS